MNNGLGSNPQAGGFTLSPIALVVAGQGTTSSGGNDSLGWSVVGDTLTIDTNGEYSFGDTAPNFIMLLDVNESPDGDLDLATIRKGAGVTITQGGVTPFTVASNSKMGKGVKIGCIEDFATSNEGTTYPQMEVLHSSHKRFFEARSSNWPTANSDNAAGILALTNGTNRWGIKPIWNFAVHGEYAGQDTDLYMVGLGTGFYNPDNRFLGQINASSNSQSIGGSNLAFTPLVNPLIDVGLPFQRPFDDVAFLEGAWDQGSADGVTLDAEITAFQGRANGGVNKITNSNVLCSDPDGVVRVVSAFNYPGFVRGYSIPENANFFENDIYKANGDGAFCRVAITNHADYFQATKRAILEPLNWVNNQLQLKYRTGIFQGDLTGCYYNIIGVDNQQIESIAI